MLETPPFFIALVFTFFLVWPRIQESVKPGL